jgi:hypothetical protein
MPCAHSTGAPPVPDLDWGTRGRDLHRGIPGPDLDRATAGPDVGLLVPLRKRAGSERAWSRSSSPVLAGDPAPPRARSPYSAGSAGAAYAETMAKPPENGPF